MTTDPAAMPELLPCPFCGSKAYTKTWYNGYYTGPEIGCNKCGFHFSGFADQPQSILDARWNTRANKAIPSEVVERAVSLLDEIYDRVGALDPSDPEDIESVSMLRRSIEQRMDEIAPFRKKKP